MFLLKNEQQPIVQVENVVDSGDTSDKKNVDALDESVVDN